MKFNLYLILILAAALFLGCEKSEVITNDSFIVITATIERVGTKTTIDGNKVLWEVGDEIMVFDAAATGYKYVLSGGAGTSNGTFTIASADAVPAEITAALYPFNADAVFSVENSSFTTSAPAIYNYTDNSANKAAMAALGSNLNFKIAGALVEVNVNNIPAGYNQISIASTEGLNQSSLISFDDKGNPLHTISSNSSSETAVEFESSVVSTDRTFYIPVPTGDFTNVKIALSNGSNDLVLREMNTRTFDRAARYYASYTLSSDGKAPGTIETDDEVTEAFKTNPNIILTDTDASSIILPKASEMTDPGEPVSITFNNKTESAPIVISAADPTDAPADLTIIVPDNTIPQMEINLPASTVTLVTTGLGKFSTIVAATAENTLVIPEGVEVDNLMVKVGNVRISGKAGKIENQKSSGKVTIYKDEWADIPDGLDNGKFDIVSFKSISTESELQEAFQTGGNYALAANIAVNSTLTVPAGKEVSLDLNGNDLIQEKECTQTYNMIVNKGSLTLIGKGIISFEDLGSGLANEATNTIRNEGTLLIGLDKDYGHLSNLGPRGFNQNSTAFCYPIDNYNSGKVTVNSGTVYAPKSRSLRNFYTNGEIVINGGTFKGQVWIQQGSAGTDDTGTDKVCKLTVTGGNFSPTGADGSSIFITNKQYDNVTLSVTGGTFNTKIGSSFPAKTGVAGKITGGIFTESAKANTASWLFANGTWSDVDGEGFYTFSTNQSYPNGNTENIENGDTNEW